VTKAELLAHNRYMVLSTADASGRPWASPVWFAPDGEDAFLWISRPDTRHSLNIADRPAIAIVIFDSSKPPAERQALYVDAVAREAGPDPGLVETYSRHSVAQGLGELAVAEVTPPDGVFRLYRAAASEMWMLEDEADRRIPAA
jgi:pyridoxamine 5'-phosphate oxidase-like protein